MFQALQSAGVLLLQLLAGGPAPQIVPQPEMFKIVSMTVIKDSLVEHRTDLFRFQYPGEDTDSKFPGFAVRRGMPFNVSVEVTRPLDLDTMRWEMQISDESASRFTVTKCYGIDQARPSEAGKYFYVVEATTRVADPIGKYQDVSLTVGMNEELYQFQYPFPVYVLYNPYHPADAVFVADKEMRRNYLEAENGVYFQGETSAVEEDHWYYAQYEPVMLEAAFYLLQGLNASELRDPRATVRTVVKKLGYWDEASPAQGNPHGLLNGHWFDENFSGGTNPDDWVSSLDIVQQWYDNDKTPVNYGQCWVFAALGRSLFASMGLVSRQVSGYSTMVDGSVTQYTDGLETHSFSDDKIHHVVIFFVDDSGAMRFQWGMIWNFHSWAEVYMRSEAESRKYDGWHAADPTLPGGGPSPVRAIHDLHEGYQYDTTEMIGDIHCTVVMKLVKCSPEVDARKMPANTTTCPEVKTLSVNARGAPVVLSSSPNNSQKRMDITASYVNHSVDAFVPLEGGKYPYPKAMAEASLDKPTSDQNSLEPAPEAESAAPFKLRVTSVSDAVLLGHSVRVNVEVSTTPEAGQVRGVEVAVAADLLRVNSPKRLASVHRQQTKVVLSRANNWRASVPVTVSVAEMVANGALTLGPFRHVVEFGVLATDRDSQEAHFERHVVMLQSPKVQVQAPERMSRAHADGRFEAKVTSPFPKEVRNACVKVTTMHSAKLGIDGVQCFDKMSPGEEVMVSRTMGEGAAKAAAGSYPISFVVSHPEHPSTKAVHTLYLE